MKADFKKLKPVVKEHTVHIRQYVNNSYTVFTAKFSLSDSSGNEMEFNTNDDFICQLPDGRFRLEVYLDKIDGRMVDYGISSLFFDCVKINDKVIQPTIISDESSFGKAGIFKYTYEYDVDNDAIIKVCYHTEN